MCGIVGIVGKGDIAPELVKCIARLEYRGYDSCGLATLNSGGIEVRKDVGPVSQVACEQGLALAHGGLGIAHTRWATHGGVSQENAHPHVSCDKTFAVVHNGIVSNYQALRKELQSQGHRFSSETDTEVFAHLLEETHGPGTTVEEAFVKALRYVHGTFAVAMISSHDREKIFCAREKSPLILGLAAEANFIGSDVNAFLPYTRRAIVLNDGEYAVLSRDGICVRAIANEKPILKQTMEIDWHVEAADKLGHEHYMEKEIWEQPEVVRRALEVPQGDITSLAQLMLKAQRNILVGVGTTYYVALFGQYLLAQLAQVFAPAISSDEAETLALTNPQTLLLAISQSGETFDTLQALRQAKATGAPTAAIVNVPGSSMTREAGMFINQNSGPEICVISTKAAMAQMVLLIRLATEIAYMKKHKFATNGLQLLKELAHLPRLIEITLETKQEQIHKLALKYHEKENWFFLGRGSYTPIAFESALKMKEVTYLHAEGMPAGFGVLS